MKSWKGLLFLLKASIFVWMAWVVYQRFSAIPFAIQREAARSFLSTNLTGVLIVFAMMPLNWLLEIFKWKLLLKHSGGANFRQSAISVLGGLSIGFASPGRIGEFAGRALMLPEKMRRDSLYLSAIGGLAQSFITFAVALLLLPFIKIESIAVAARHLYIPIAAFALLLLAAFFFFGIIARALQRFPAIAVIETELPETMGKLKILLISGARYGVYLMQYALLFHFTGMQQGPLLLIASVAVLLAAQSLSPLSPMADVVTRGGLSLLLFQGYPRQALAVAAVPLALWCINLLLPALAGYFFILKWNGDAAK